MVFYLRMFLGLCTVWRPSSYVLPELCMSESNTWKFKCRNMNYGFFKLNQCNTASIYPVLQVSKLDEYVATLLCTSHRKFKTTWSIITKLKILCSYTLILQLKTNPYYSKHLVVGTYKLKLWKHKKHKIELVQ